MEAAHIAIERSQVSGGVNEHVQVRWAGMQKTDRVFTHTPALLHSPKGDEHEERCKRVRPERHFGEDFVRGAEKVLAGHDGEEKPAHDAREEAGGRRTGSCVEVLREVREHAHGVRPPEEIGRRRHREAERREVGRHRLYVCRLRACSTEIGQLTLERYTSASGQRTPWA